MRTKEEFLEYWGRAFQSILFAGYMCPDADAGMRYRKMQNDDVRLRALLARVWEETNGKK